MQLLGDAFLYDIPEELRYEIASQEAPQYEEVLLRIAAYIALCGGYH